MVIRLSVQGLLVSRACPNERLRFDRTDRRALRSDVGAFDRPDRGAGTDQDGVVWGARSEWDANSPGAWGPPVLRSTVPTALCSTIRPILRSTNLVAEPAGVSVQPISLDAGPLAHPFLQDGGHAPFRGRIDTLPHAGGQACSPLARSSASTGSGSSTVSNVTGFPSPTSMVTTGSSNRTASTSA